MRARQRVPGAERDRQGLARGDEMRELDWRLYSDHDAVRPVVTYYPKINFDLPRKASSRCRFRPVVQHALGPDVARPGEIGPSEIVVILTCRPKSYAPSVKETKPNRGFQSISRGAYRALPLISHLSFAFASRIFSLAIRARV